MTVRCRCGRRLARAERWDGPRPLIYVHGVTTKAYELPGPAGPKLVLPCPSCGELNIRNWARLWLDRLAAGFEAGEREVRL